MVLKDVYMGTLVPTWMNKKNIKYITFSVTDDCNLMCKYCYFTHKTTKNKMTFDVAKKAIDYILSEEKFQIHDGVVWDFIGGEPTLEMDLIDEICDYILYRMYTMNHKWLYCYRIMIGTNGLLYSSKKFQDFLMKHKYNLHVNITVDGSKEKHDLSRIKKDGTGSYDDIVKILPLWFKQTGNYSTKATFAHQDLPYLKDSIINLWNLGFTNVMANVVFENVWSDKDDIIYESQLRELADYIIDKQIWDKVSVRFFSPNIGYPIEDQLRRSNFCGSGNMLAIDHKGNFFPCIRFMNSALNNKKGRLIGNSEDGILPDKLRAFNTLSYDSQSPKKCLTCDISSGCTWCTGFNYDEASTETIFERQTYNCKMHQANVRANRYFWKLYEEKTGLVSPLRYNMYTANSSLNKYLYIYKNDLVNPCHIDSNQHSVQELSDNDYSLAIKYCDANNIIPIFVGFDTKKDFGYYIGNIHCKYERDKFTIDVLDHKDVQTVNINKLSSTLIYSVNYNELEYIFDDIKKIIEYNYVNKVSILIRNYYKWDKNHLKNYEKILEEFISLIVEAWAQKNFIQIDVITDNILTTKKIFCPAGTYQWALAPNGMVYSCIGEYFKDALPISSIDSFQSNECIKKQHKELQVCQICNVKHCNKCYVLNKQLTCESIVPFEIHCVKSNLELLYSTKLIRMLDEKNVRMPFDINRQLIPPKDLDPLITLCGENSFANQEYYKL